MPSPDPLAAWLKLDAHATQRHQEAYARVNFGLAAKPGSAADVVQNRTLQASTAAADEANVISDGKQ